MARKYTSISVETTLSATISSSATSIIVANAAALIGDVTFAGGNVDQFTVAIDPDTVNEEILFVTAANTGTNTLTVVRARGGTTAIIHNTGATIKHVLTGDDLTAFASAVSPISTMSFTGSTSGSTTVQASAAASGTLTLPAATDTLVGRATTETLTNKTINAANNTLTGVVTPTSSDTLTNKTLTSAINISPEERCTVSATAATGTINYDVLTQGVLYYTSNATANFTLNFRGSSGATLSSILATGDSVSAVFLNTNGTTAYYPTTFQIDGSAVTPKWSGGTAPTAGNASSIDAYSFTIVKTAATPTYTVLAGQARFA